MLAKRVRAQPSVGGEGWGLRVVPGLRRGWWRCLQAAGEPSPALALPFSFPGLRLLRTPSLDAKWTRLVLLTKNSVKNRM